MTLDSQPTSTWEEKIARRALEIMPPTSSAWRLYEILGEVDACGAEIEAAARLDPLYAAELIRFANTAQFGRADVATAGDAIARVGHARLRRHSLTYAFRSLAAQPLRAYGLSGEEFYLKSVACAAAMQALTGGDAESCGEMYNIGLLHAIGEVIIDAAISERQAEPVRLSSVWATRLRDMEESALGLNQAQVAGLTLRRWRFPERVVAPIEQQFEADTSSEHFETTQTLVMARYVAQKILDTERGIASSVGQSRQIVYRGHALSDVFEYARQQALELVRVAAA